MTDRRLLELLLEKVTKIEAEQQAQKAMIQKIESEQQAQKAMIQKIESEQQAQKVMIQKIESEQHAQKSSIRSLESAYENFRKEVIARLDRLEEKQELIYNQTAKLTEYHYETMERLNSIQEDQKSIHEILGEHEVAIRTLRRKPV